MSAFRTIVSRSQAANDNDVEKGYDDDRETCPFFDDTSKDDADEESFYDSQCLEPLGESPIEAIPQLTPNEIRKFKVVDLKKN